MKVGKPIHKDYYYAFFHIILCNKIKNLMILK